MPNVYDPEQLKDKEHNPYDSNTTPGKDSYNSDSKEESKSLDKPSANSFSTTAGDVSHSSSGGPEESLYKPSPASSSTKKVGFVFNLFGSRRRKIIFGAGGIGTIASLVLFFSLASGPLQFVHFAQLLQQFHFTHNQEFSDQRSTRTILYSLRGQSNRSRLGVITNKYADRWENKLVEETGLKPVYTRGFNRFAGFQVLDQDLASSYLSDFQKDGINTNASSAGVVDTKGNALAKNSQFVDVTSEKFRTRRSVIRVIGKGTETTKVISAIGSRLLIQRGGIDFHPLKNAVREKVDTAFAKKIRQADADKIRNGVDSEVPQQHPSDAKDKNGKPEATAADQQAADEANNLTNAAKSADSLGPDGSKVLKSLKAGLSKGAGATAIIGALCAVKSFGDSVPDYQYRNTILPMMRLGGQAITMGNQVMSGQGLNLDELGVYSKSLNDPDTKTSWTQARSIQAELGQPQTGPDIPPEAKPSSVGDKPAFFDFIDSIPVLGQTCGLSSAISGLPIIKNVSNLASSAVIASINTTLHTAGTNYTVEGLLNSAVGVVAGRGVDPYAQGADLGNIANYGARLAANDQAISNGGRALTTQEVAALNIQQQRWQNFDNSHLSFSQRYLSPYSASSVVSKLIDKSPTSPSQTISALASLPKNLEANLFSLPNAFSHKTQAATTYDYGFPEFGFSAAEQSDPRFDDPFENAQIVESRLAELNDKYGDCFSMDINPTSLDLESGDAVKFNKIPAKCSDSSDLDLLRYRFYLADTVTAHSLACYEGDEDSCTQLGFESTTESTTPPSPSPVSGNAQQLAQQILSNKNIDLASFSSTVLQDVQAAASGKPGTAGAPLSAAILQLIATVGQNHRVLVTALESGGQGHSTNSQHYSGDAVDFGVLDDKALSGRDPGSVTIINIATKILPKGSGFGQSGCGSQINLPAGFIQFADTCNHLHVQVPDGTP